MKSLLAGLLSTLVIFGLAEVGSYFWLNEHGNALDKTKPVLAADTELGWKQRANLDTKFLKIPLETNSLGWRAPELKEFEQFDRTILMLGPSSTFGWGVAEEETYSAQLQELLGGSTGVINAGEIGYSSYQGLKLYERTDLSTLTPDIVILAYGVNDLDRYRFYFQSTKSDADELRDAKPSTPVTIENALSKSSLYTFATNMALKIRKALLPAPAPKPVDTAAMLADSLLDPIPSIRVSPEEFRTNMTEMIRLARERGASVVVLSSAVYLPEVPPLSEETKKMFAKGKESWRAGDFIAAEEAFAETTRLDPVFPDPYYYRAALELQRGNINQAAKEFEQARTNETSRIVRDVPAYNEMAWEIGRTENVPVVDIDSCLVPGERKEFFVDPIHFSTKGNALVAGCIFDILQENNLAN